MLTSSRAFESVGLTKLCILFCCFSVGTFGTNFPRLIVNQFKWLDRLLDSQVGARCAITWMLFPNNFWNASQVGLDWIIVLMRIDVVLVFRYCRRDFFLFCYVCLEWPQSIFYIFLLFLLCLLLHKFISVLVYSHRWPHFKAVACRKLQSPLV